MLYFSFCFYLIHGPVPPEHLPPRVPAERLFGILETVTGLPVAGDGAGLDTIPVVFHEEERNRSEAVIKLVLRAHEIYVHDVPTENGTVGLVASRSRKPPRRPARPLAVKVYAPRHVVPEKLVEALAATPEGAAVTIILEPRTGKILLKAPEAEPVKRALEAARTLDAPSPRGRTYHLYRCDGMFVRDAHAELLRRLPRAVRARLVLVPYTKVNTLVIACGTDDWQTVFALLRKINPQGARMNLRGMPTWPRRF